MRRVLAACVVLLVTVPCLGATDCDFNALVKTIEARYGVHRTRIPLLGFATFCLRVAGTPGAAGLKIAVFNDGLNSRTVSADSFEQSVETAIDSRWHPLVRARSREDGSLTVVYTQPDSKELRVLVVTLEGDDATIVQTKVKTSQIWKWITEPQDAVDRDRSKGADLPSDSD